MIYMCLFLFLDSTGKTYHAWGDRAAVKEKAKGKNNIFRTDSVFKFSPIDHEYHGQLEDLHQPPRSLHIHDAYCDVLQSSLVSP